MADGEADGTLASSSSGGPRPPTLSLLLGLLNQLPITKLWRVSSLDWERLIIREDSGADRIDHRWKITATDWY
ncbi:hypothetical protein SORBI_3002G035100 [Sorghum bicolor]|uniref:Uncharacterized protein n=1 Tax=Sorghum bicolor TaxID=4558 RepID=A0A1B6Q907_SORBI|nr:hypothetical protein SORBI_3002G035100 [Sorghum bicolor]